MNTQPIGVFDSGVGGLSVLRHLVHFMPQEEYVYLGDTARVPYGNKSPETVVQYSLQCARFLELHNVKHIIIACNTASAVALREVRSASSVPVTGVIEPSVQAAIAQTRNGRIGVLGTRATVGSNAYTKHIEQHADGRRIEVIGQPCPLFVPLAEEGWVAHPATRAIAEEYMKPLVMADADTVILGCTHYPLLRATIQDAIPTATLIDPGEHTALTVQETLRSTDALAPLREIPSTRITYYVTDIPATFPQVAKQFLGFDVPQPRLVSIEQLAG
ncbi:MAG: glutamate racemase [Candidatus Kapabacteria bacterium]|nr:glutamate racemase [Candidatus Kapabacteria bacterium]